MIRYKLVGWEFNRPLWSAAIATAANEMGVEFVALSMEVSPSAIDNWAHGRYHADAPYPNMTNFIKACNLLGLDPRDFFVLGEE